MNVPAKYEDIPAVVDDVYQAWVEMGDWDEYDHLYEYLEA
jgi:hypothetical protein